MIEAGTNTDEAHYEPEIEAKETIPAPVVITRVLRKRKRKRIRACLMNSSNCRYDLVRYTASKFGMKEALENWNVYWTDLSISVQRCKEMKRYQRINHFPGMLEICRKDLLARNMNRMLKVFPEEYNVFPKTWCLPTDMTEVAEYAKAHKGRCFIVKPDLGCQGRGICITRNINQLKTYDKMICQLYIQRPFLIDGYKFDLRIYTLITSCEPLRVFVYNEGLARFATAKYKEPNSVNASNMYMHLTNYSVNKHSRTYVVDEIDGSKRKLSTINQWFLKNNFDVKKIWNSIDDVIIKTIIVSLPTLRHYYHTCFPHHFSSHACFEILGFDFMFDHRLKPYVLEVNHSPSFHTDTAIDHEVKESLLYDTFNLLNLSQNNRIKVLIEDKKRARDRLFTTSLSNDTLCKEKENDDRLTQGRIDWEDSHLGNYRKIYPNAREEYYSKFIFARQNTVCVEAGTSRNKDVTTKVQGEHGKGKKYKSSASSPIKDKAGPEEPPKPKSAPTCPTLLVPKNFQPGIIDEADEKERITSMEKRTFLIKSHGILEKVYEHMKNAGLLKMEDDIKHTRSNKWEETGEGGKSYRDRYQLFNRNMAAVLECASLRKDLKPVKLEALETLALEPKMDNAVLTEEPKDAAQEIPNEDVPKMPQEESEKSTALQADSGCEAPEASEPNERATNLLKDDSPLTEKAEKIGNRSPKMNRAKVKLPTKYPEHHAAMAEGDFAKRPTERQELRLGSISPRGINGDQEVKVMTGSTLGTTILRVGHLGNPKAWPNLEHYIAHSTMLNRDWQNTNV